MLCLPMPAAVQLAASQFSHSCCLLNDHSNALLYVQDTPKSVQIALLLLVIQKPLLPSPKTPMKPSYCLLLRDCTIRTCIGVCRENNYNGLCGHGGVIKQYS